MTKLFAKFPVYYALFVIDQLQAETPSQTNHTPKDPPQDHINLTSLLKPNYCVNLVRELFTANEIRDPEIRGKRGKKKLDEGMTYTLSYD